MRSIGREVNNISENAQSAVNDIKLFAHREINYERTSEFPQDEYYHQMLTCSE